ncbi:hypothetical protein HG530_000507 [Fusarium avenaceum]|nr:hypothetical protein HG530_000507 [Fusarium avenaceum]
MVTAAALHMSNVLRPSSDHNPQDINGSYWDPSRRAMVDALEAKQRALYLLRIAFQNLEAEDRDMVLTAAMLLVTADMIDSGKHGSKAHLDGIGWLLSHAQPATTVGEMLKDFVISDCYIFYVFALTFMDPIPKSSIALNSTLASSAIHYAARNSFICCPAEILQILWSTAMILQEPTKDDNETIKTNKGVKLIMETMAFDVEMWSHDIQHVPKGRQVTDIQSRIHTGYTHQTACCLYIMYAIPSVRDFLPENTEQELEQGVLRASRPSVDCTLTYSLLETLTSVDLPTASAAALPAFDPKTAPDLLRLLENSSTEFGIGVIPQINALVDKSMPVNVEHETNLSAQLLDCDVQSVTGVVRCSTDHSHIPARSKKLTSLLRIRLKSTRGQHDGFRGQRAVYTVDRNPDSIAVVGVPLKSRECRQPRNLNIVSLDGSEIIVDQTFTSIFSFDGQTAPELDSSINFVSLVRSAHAHPVEIGLKVPLGVRCQVNPVSLFARNIVDNWQKILKATVNNSIGTGCEVGIATGPALGALVDKQNSFCAVLRGGESGCKTGISTAYDQDIDVRKWSHDVLQVKK